jgi:hypothetical protein
MRTVTSLFAFAAAALASVGMTSTGHATTYNLDVCGGNGLCPGGAVFGTVDITGGGSSLTYAFDITNGGDLHFGGGNSIDTLLMDVAGTITTTAFSNSTFSFASDSSPNGDGLGTFTNAFKCTDGGTGGACGTTVTVTFTGSNLAADFTLTGGQEIFAGADVTCVASGSSTCSNDPSFQTGAVGATLAAATPLPATLPLFAGGLGFVGYLTRRRRKKSNQALAAA